MHDSTELKLNMGCGFRKKEGYVNVDHDLGCMPDQHLDASRARWPWADGSVDEVVFEYSMEQMGQDLNGLRHVISEIYRVTKPGARVLITAVHPRHDHFVNNPACTQRLSPDFFHLLSFGRNMEMISSGLPHDVFAFKWGVNFDVTRFKFLIAPEFQDDVETGRVSEDEIRRRMHHENNVCQAFEVDLAVFKNVVVPQERTSEPAKAVESPS